MKFNEKILELRKQKGWSQEELGEKINVSRQTISKYETGQSSPEMEKLLEISKVFNISIDELVGKETKTFAEVKKHNSKKWLVLLFVIIIFILIFLYKAISFTIIYLRANSFSENNYYMGEYLSNESDNMTIVIKTTKIDNKIKIETITDSFERPDMIEYIEINEKKAYLLSYNKEKDKYIVENKLDDFNSDEEIEEYFNSFSDNKIKETTLSMIPSNVKSIVSSSLNPFCNVSYRNNVIYNNFISHSIKNRICLNREGLVERYDMNGEFDNNISMNISYDYVQDHLKDYKEINPLEEYKDMIISESN